MCAAPINLLNLDRQGCEQLAVQLGGKPFHGRNLFKWVHKHGALDVQAMTDLSAALRQRLAAETVIELPRVVREQQSVDGTIKWVMELGDGQRIETVSIPEPRRLTLCISSQVGCGLGCPFCATARQGLSRNLSTAEIIGQVWVAARRLAEHDRRPSNIVLMGMGEPLANLKAVVTAVNIMQDDLAYLLAYYRVTLSTAGLVPQIARLRSQCRVALAVSLHAPDDALRNELVPINRRYPLAQLVDACRAYVAADQRQRITWEYIMLDGVNDHLHQAKALVRLLQGVPSKVNLIPFNPFLGSDYAPSPAEQIAAFRERLMRSGIVTTIRKPRGDEIAAACGQLVGRVEQRRVRPSQVAAAFAGGVQ